MSRDYADHHDAELILKIYELRREEVMRESRNLINGQFWPKRYEDIAELMNNFGDRMNAAFRQTSSYWEMVYGFAKRGVVNADFLMESNGEGLMLYAKCLPFIPQIRKDYSPLSFQNTEWIATNCEEGKKRLEILKARVEKLAKSK